MVKVFEEGNDRTCVGTKFQWADIYTLRFAELTVDKNGNIIYASWGKENGQSYKATKSENNGLCDFDACVRSAMDFLLHNDTSEFKNMRDSLSPKYRQMAEDIRKAELSKYDF